MRHLQLEFVSQIYYYAGLNQKRGLNFKGVETSRGVLVSGWIKINVRITNISEHQGPTKE